MKFVIQVVGRAFFLSDGSHDGFKEVWLSAHAVDGLSKMNKKKPGEMYDTIFMKAMLIGFCTMKMIKENDAIDEGILQLIKGNPHLIQ